MSASLGAWILIFGENPIGPIRLAFSLSRTMYFPLSRQGLIARIRP
jgi:hypothetical protein